MHGSLGGRKSGDFGSYRRSGNGWQQSHRAVEGASRAHTRCRDEGFERTVARIFLAGAGRDQCRNSRLGEEAQRELAPVWRALSSGATTPTPCCIPPASPLSCRDQLLPKNQISLAAKRCAEDRTSPRA